MDIETELKVYQDAIRKLAEAERVFAAARQMAQEALARLNERLLEKKD